MLNKQEAERLLEIIYEDMKNNKDDFDKPLDEGLKSKLLKEIKDM